MSQSAAKRGGKMSGKNKMKGTYWSGLPETNNTKRMLLLVVGGS
jgi:hypothetical protein